MAASAVGTGRGPGRAERAPRSGPARWISAPLCEGPVGPAHEQSVDGGAHVVKDKPTHPPHASEYFGSQMTHGARSPAGSVIVKRRATRAKTVCTGGSRSSRGAPSASNAPL